MNPIEVLLIWCLFVLAICMAFVGCASTPMPHNDLINQIVRMRPGYAGLTHRICAKKKWTGECTNWDLIEYQIRNQEGRMRFIDLGFICMVGGRRFKLDPNLPQFVRYGDVDHGWFSPKTTEIVETLSYKDVQKMVDAGTYCFSERVYPDGIPF